MKKLFTVLLLFLSSCVTYAAPIEVNYDDGIYHIVLSGEKMKKQIKFISSSNLITNKEAHLTSNSLLTVNAGFFDPKNQKTISYVVNDSIIVADPLFNESLMSNPVLRQNMTKIINR